MSCQAENRTAGQQVHIEDGILIAREKKKTEFPLGFQPTTSPQL